jgi:hypothetical protein
MTKLDAGWRTVLSAVIYFCIYLLLKYAYEQASLLVSPFDDMRPLWRACIASCAAVSMGGGLVFVMLDVTPGKED